MNRFQLPTLADEYYLCEVCDEYKHYEDFPSDTDNCVCIDCTREEDLTDSE